MQGWVDSYNGPTGLLAAVSKAIDVFCITTMRFKVSYGVKLYNYII